MQIVFYFQKNRENTCGKWRGGGGGMTKPVVLPVEFKGGEGGGLELFAHRENKKKTRGISLRSLIKVVLSMHILLIHKNVQLHN